MIFDGRKEIVLLGKALKFGVFFKYALKLKEIFYELLNEIREKCIIFRNRFYYRGKMEK